MLPAGKSREELSEFQAKHPRLWCYLIPATIKTDGSLEVRILRAAAQYFSPEPQSGAKLRIHIFSFASYTFP